MRVIIGIGSNTDDAAEKIQLAFEELGVFGDALAVTRALETKDIRGRDVAYLNALAMLDTEMPKETLIALLKDVEAKLGRDRSTPDVVAIDLDLLAYGSDISPELMERPYNRILVAELVAK